MQVPWPGRLPRPLLSPRRPPSQPVLHLIQLPLQLLSLPLLLRSDRGPEFKNLLMKDFTALLGLRHRFGAPWRPVEQSAVERVPQVAQRMLGVLVHDVLQMSLEHWTEALPVLEFVIYNTAGPHG